MTVNKRVTYHNEDRMLILGYLTSAAPRAAATAEPSDNSNLIPCMSELTLFLLCLMNGDRAYLYFCCVVVIVIVV